MRRWHEIDTKQEAIDKTICDHSLSFIFSFDNTMSFDHNLDILMRSLKEKNSSDFEKIITSFYNNLIHFNNLKYGSKDYFSNYQVERKIAYGDWGRFVKKHFNNFGNRVIFVGINDGQEVKELGLDSACKEIYGIDISESAHRKCKAENPFVNCIQSKSSDIPLESNSFDSFISLRTLQVTGVDRKNSIVEAHRLLKKGGTF
jgi:SAM-dependent methyltransferase